MPWLQAPWGKTLPMSCIRSQESARNWAAEYKSLLTVKSYSKQCPCNKGNLKLQLAKAITKTYASHCSSCLCQWNKMEYSKVSRDSQKNAGTFSHLHWRGPVSCSSPSPAVTGI